MRTIEGLGAIGFAVGLFAPPLLAATAVGAVIGAGAGKLLHHRTASKLEEQAGAALRARIAPRPPAMPRRKYQRSLQLMLLAASSERLGIPPRQFLL